MIWKQFLFTLFSTYVPMLWVIYFISIINKSASLCWDVSLIVEESWWTSEHICNFTVCSDERTYLIVISIPTSLNFRYAINLEIAKKPLFYTEVSRSVISNNSLNVACIDDNESNNNCSYKCGCRSYDYYRITLSVYSW